MENLPRNLLIVQVLLAIFVSVTAATAQKVGKATPFVGTLNDFAGTWEIQPKLSEFGASTAADFKNYEIRLTIDGSNLKVLKTFDRHGDPCSLSYVLDLSGKGEKNKIRGCIPGSVEIESKTNVKDNSIIRVYTYKFDTGWDKIIETYRLYGNADTLVYESLYDSLIAHSYLKFVFHRKNRAKEAS